jgi:hypothetical protein
MSFEALPAHLSVDLLHMDEEQGVRVLLIERRSAEREGNRDFVTN